jgi:hypothetical protein
MKVSNLAEDLRNLKQQLAQAKQEAESLRKQFLDERAKSEQVIER